MPLLLYCVIHSDLTQTEESDGCSLLLALVDILDNTPGASSLAMSAFFDEAIPNDALAEEARSYLIRQFNNNATDVVLLNMLYLTTIHIIQHSDHLQRVLASGGMSALVVSIMRSCQYQQCAVAEQDDNSRAALNMALSLVQYVFAAVIHILNNNTVNSILLLDPTTHNAVARVLTDHIDVVNVAPFIARGLVGAILSEQVGYISEFMLNTGSMR